MRAAVIAEGALQIEERPDPVPGPGELLIQIRAAGVNGADLSQRAGRYPPPPGAPVDIPGLECAGETAQGRRVMALLPGGGHAELAVVDESHTLPVPEHVPGRRRAASSRRSPPPTTRSSPRRSCARASGCS